MEKMDTENEVFGLFFRLGERKLKTKEELVVFLQDELLYASNKGYVEIVALILKAGIREHLNEALILASRRKNNSIIKMLVGAGADVTANQNYPIRKAVETENAEIVEFLLEAGADATVFDNYLIKLAAELGSEKIVKVLLQYGADSSVDNNYPEYVARKKGYKKIVEIFERINSKFTIVEALEN